MCHAVSGACGAKCAGIHTLRHHPDSVRFRLTGRSFPVPSARHARLCRAARAPRAPRRSQLSDSPKA